MSPVPFAIPAQTQGRAEDRNSHWIGGPGKRGDLCLLNQKDPSFPSCLSDSGRVA